MACSVQGFGTCLRKDSMIEHVSREVAGANPVSLTLGCVLGNARLRGDGMVQGVPRSSRHDS